MKFSAVLSAHLVIFVSAAGILSDASAQSAPSWRAESERPERVEAPPDVDSPDISFEIDRESLFGQPMGFAPDSETLTTQPSMTAPEPMLEPEMTPGVQADVATDAADEVAVDIPAIQPADEVVAPAVADVTPAASGSDAPPVDGSADESSSASSLSPEPEALVSSDLPSAQTPAADAEPNSAIPSSSTMGEEAAAVDEVVVVDPESSVASIAELDTSAKPVARDRAAGFRLNRIRTVQPNYPKEAARLGEEGWVDLRLTITPDGKVSRALVVDAKPRQVFDSAARRAARQWRFEAPEASGIVDPVEARIRMSFVLD